MNKFIEIKKVDKRFKYYKSPYNMRWMMNVRMDWQKPRSLSDLLIPSEHAVVRSQLVEHFMNVYGADSTHDLPYKDEFIGDDYEIYRIYVRDENMITAALLAI